MNYLLTIDDETSAYDGLEGLAIASNGLDADSGLTIRYHVEEADGQVRDLTADEFSELENLCTYYAEN
jgi:hypothetical protein